MEWLWKRPKGVKVTTLCIAVDRDFPKVCVDNPDEDLAGTMYNYIWLIVRALSQKKAFFKKYSDYDDFSFFATIKIYETMVAHQKNAGKIIHGREVKPVKSVLNYTKALLFPLKITYQNKFFGQVSSTDPNSKYYGVEYKEVLDDNVRQTTEVNNTLIRYLESSLSPRNLDLMLDDILQTCHFPKGSKEYKNLKYSILVSALDSMRKKDRLYLSKAAAFPSSVVWNGNRALRKAIFVYLQTFYDRLKQELTDCYHCSSMSEGDIQNIINNQITEVLGKGSNANEG